MKLWYGHQRCGVTQHCTYENEEEGFGNALQGRTQVVYNTQFVDGVHHLENGRRGLKISCTYKRAHLMLQATPLAKSLDCHCTVY